MTSQSHSKRIGRTRRLAALFLGLTTLLGLGVLGLGTVSASASTNGQITDQVVWPEVTVSGSNFPANQVERVGMYRSQYGNSWGSASVTTTIPRAVWHPGGWQFIPGGTFTVTLPLPHCNPHPSLAVEASTPVTIHPPVTLFIVNSNVLNIPAGVAIC